MKLVAKYAVFLAALVFASVTQAATYDFNGQTITYQGASTPTTVGNDLVITFTSSGSLTLPVNYTARALVIGGGGAGGRANTSYQAGGGGGAGEMIDRSGLSLVSGTYTITVGNGGIAPTSGSAVGGSGEESSIVFNGSNIVRAYGGGGGGYNTTAGVQGGSGGGGGGRSDNNTAVNGGAAQRYDTTYGTANAGGSGRQYCAGGGGGAGVAGGAATGSSAAGSGGAGNVSDITGSPVTYAGGGGGGSSRNGNSYYYTLGSGGAGGGGAGAQARNGATTAAVAGTANTGSGGGGGARYSSTYRQNPANGGSGIVVIRLSNPSVCRIDTTYYETLAAAVAAANESGDTIELLKNITLDADLTINKDVTITSEGSNNYTITRARQFALNITGDVKFANITVDGGITWANSTISGIVYTGSNASQGKSLITVASGASLTLNSGATIQNFWGRKMDAGDPDTYAAINNAGTLVINNGAVLKDIRHRAFQTASYAAQMGGAVYSTGTVTVNGGMFQNCYSVGKGGAIYAAGGTVNITGGTITGCAAAQGGGAVYVESDATLNVSGSPTITANNKIADGATTGTKNNVEAEGNTINLANNLTGAVGVASPANAQSGSVFGTADNRYTGVENFTYDTDASFSAARKDGALVWIKPVCEVNGASYGSLEDAVAAANDGDTITLLANVTIDSTVTVNKNVTITSKSGTYAIQRGSDNAVLSTTGNVTLKNVTIDSNGKNSTTMLAVNGGSLTADESVDITQDAVLFQGQEVTFAGGTLLSASNANGLTIKYTETGSNNSLGIPSDAQVDYLVVGGGGSGGKSSSNSAYGASGNGGEVKSGEDQFLAGQYTIKVGQGGTAQTTNGNNGNSGGNSSITGATTVTAVGGTGGAGGSQAGKAGVRQNSDPETSEGVTSSLSGDPVSYGAGGPTASSTSRGTAGTDGTGAGGQGNRSGSSYPSGKGGDGIVVVNIKSLKTVVDGGIRATGAKESFVIADPAWGDDWTVRSDDPSFASVAKTAEGVVVTGVDEGWTTIRVENDDTIYTYTVYVSQEPHVVNFCEGDQVQIWYNDPTPGQTEWFLLINTNRYELGEVGEGDQMRVVLDLVGDTDGRTYILGEALYPRESADVRGDLVIISDGKRFYGYRMSVDGPREIAVGESADMVCSTVAIKTWASEVDDEYAEFVDVDCTNKEPGEENHSTTATITGLAITDEAYVRVRDDIISEGEHNAQGAVYTLKVAVTGVPTIPVNLSPGVEMPVGWSFPDATNGTVYSVVVSNDQQVLAYKDFTVSADGKSFSLTLSAADANAADFGKTEYVTVLADGEPVVTYAPTVSYVFQMTEGQEAAGFLWGVKKTPWVTTSLNPDIVAVEPSVYGSMNSGKATALKAGDAWFYSTNAYWQAGYFGIHATVADTHLTALSMPVNTTTNFVVGAADGLPGVWTVNNGSANLTATVSPTAVATNVAEVTIKSGDVSGPVVFTVSTPYHIEEFRVFVDSESSAGKTKVFVPGHLQVVKGETMALPTNCVSSMWTATSVTPGIADVVDVSGTTGTPVRVTGISATGRTPDGKSTSEAMITVENETTIYVYHVDVVLPEDVSRDAGVINVGQTVEMSVEMFENVTKVESANPHVLSVAYDPATGKVTTTGVSEGMAQIRVTTADAVHVINVQVRNSHIDKHVTLFIGADGSTVVPYSFTFDEILEVSRPPAWLEIKRDGKTLTFIPKEQNLNETNTQVRVQCYVDGLPTQSELHYWFTIKQLTDGRQVWSDPDGKGYISYSGAKSAVTDPATGDLILIYDDPKKIGQLEVPASWSARMDILAVGGGGSGGTTPQFGIGGGGGGAGGFSLVTNVVLQGGMFDVVVGAGATSGTNVVAGGTAQGHKGGASVLTNSFGYAFASAEGGGGGGAPANLKQIDGMNGGSGGGAAWLGSSVGVAGKGEIGDGREGGVPSARNTGGGGGGAGGAGGADRSAGAGKTSDISGETVLYAQGGVGGRNDTQMLAADGAGPGFGGAGGNGGPGGAGGDGIVIVRVKDVFRNVKVPIPGTADIAGTEAGTYLEMGLITPRFVWTNGMTYVAFDYEGKEFRSSTDAKPYRWEDVIESITGVTSVDCSLSKTEVDEYGDPLEVGVGYYNFTIRLKDGFSWEDGGGQETYGSTGGQYYRWVVAGRNRIADATIDIYKTVSKFEGTNATVTVKAFSSPEMVGNAELPKVLFLGSVCGSHSLTANTICQSLNVASAAAKEVDWYLMRKNSADLRHGTLTNKQEITTTDLNLGTMGGGQHACANYFYDRLYAIATDPELKDKYDYVILEFDGSRLAGYDNDYTYTSQAELNKQKVVADWLKPFFEANAAILVTDKCNFHNEQDGAGTMNEPWPDSAGYWRPNTYYYSSGEKWLDYNEFRALVGIVAPMYYDQVAAAESLENMVGKVSGLEVKENYRLSHGWNNATTHTYYALPRYDVQANYNNVEDLLDLLERTIKTKPYNLTLKDKIVDPEKGLNLRAVTIRVTTNNVANAKSAVPEDDWVDLICWSNDTGKTYYLDTDHRSGIRGASMVVDVSTNLITAVLSNLNFAVLSDIEIDVSDNGKFRTSEDATYNQMTGLWDKNPNDGNAFAELVDDYGTAMNIEGEAETDTPWEMTLHKITATVVNGEAYVGGEQTLELGVGDGGDLMVYYRGKPGYRLVSVSVEDEPVDIVSNSFAYAFNDVHQDYRIDIVYEPYFDTVESSPVTNVYDGAMHFYDVELKGWDPAVQTQIRYSLTPDGEYYTADVFEEMYATNNPAYIPDELTDVGEHRFYYRVYALQQGWASMDNFAEEGWVWVSTGEEGADLSVITPAPILVRPDDSELIYFDYPLPDIPYSFSGFINDEDESVLALSDSDITNGWHVASTYVKGVSGMGLYDTWVVTEDGTSVWAGDPSFVFPDDFDQEEGLANIGNYYLVPGKNFQAVEKIPLDIGDVPQGPGLDPENPLIDTGVDPAERVYDGVPTNIIVTVTTKDPADGEPLKEGEDYRIVYGIGDLANPTNPPSVFDHTENPKFVHAGTNVVWYAVEPINGQENNYFAATNYQYVTVYPREIVLESHSETWKFDGTEHAYDVITLNEGTLVNGDTLRTNTTATIVHVGTADNEFEYKILSGDPGFKGDPNDDYIVKTIVGELEVTPANITIGDVTYPDDPTEITYGEDPVTRRPNTGVEDAFKVYDGIPTNIIVDVKVPANPSDYVIKYGTNTADGVDWIGTELPLFTNVCDVAVYFAVELNPETFDPSLPWDYTAVTNFARVVITPAPLYVKPADAGQIAPGDELPDIGIVYEGLVGDDTLADVFTEDDTNGWHVVSTYDPHNPIAGEYPTKAVTGDGTDVGEGDRNLTDPSLGPWNFGNYYLVPEPNDVLVAKVCAYSNIHGLLKIETAYTNTIIPAPWSDYTRDGSPTNDIRVDRMVKPRNLTDGDLLLQWANGGVYKAWILEKDKGEEGMWTPMGMVRQQNSLVGGATNVIESFDAIYVKPDGSETQKRGYGLWLVRQNPLDGQGKPRPFYLYGQWLTGEETVTIGGTDADDVAIHYPGAHYGVVHDTMLADPDCTRGTDINGYPWTDADGADTIIINNDTSMHTYCSRLQKSKRQGGGWFDGWWHYGLSGYTQDGIATPAGVGFWYERRAAGPMTHTWAGEAKYAGDGADHDVWIVDHADAGDGKTHLAFKLGGRLAPGTVTREFIRQLFDSKSIRYLHATGKTQADGKAAMDELTADLPESARPVLALRNGTGVNTEEELAKGWIWVTVDVTDGTNEKSEADGTGDTNGAGDLWRIVVGRGVWSEP